MRRYPPAASALSALLPLALRLGQGKRDGDDVLLFQRAKKLGRSGLTPKAAADDRESFSNRSIVDQRDEARSRVTDMRCQRDGRAATAHC